MCMWHLQFTKTVVAYVSVLLVELLVAFLQNMIRVADMLLDCHGLQEKRNSQCDDT